MGLTLIDQPDQLQTEEALRFRLSDQPTGGDLDVVVVSGYAFYNHGKLHGDPDSDKWPVDYQVEMSVGPPWREIVDVSPSVSLAGFKHLSSDEADATGWEVYFCTWEKPIGLAPFRIRLIAKLGVSGGPDAWLRSLAYHFTAKGLLEPASGGWNPVTYFNENIPSKV